jgi:hypothetical protein
VLEALSTGDRRRQERLGTARHLLSCRACATYAPALLERRRALAGLSPLGWIAFAAGAAWASGWAAIRRHPGRTAAASGAVVLVAAVGTTALPAADRDSPTASAPAASAPAASAPAASAPAASAPAASAAPGEAGAAPPVGAGASAGAPALVVGGTAVPLDGAAGPLTGLALGPAQGVRLPVQDVAADEGFWLGTGPGRRVWLHLVGGGESPQQVRVGSSVSFQGQAVRLPPGGAAQLGLDLAEGSEELEKLGGYLQVERSDLVVLPR